ncbi:MAG: DNA import protein CedA1 [Sulfolobales archaeon]|nr:DNA import protein CedA1 [Sulfolobales archaeon]
MDLVELVRGMTIIVMSVAWFVFLVSWAIGWALKGSPIPFRSMKRTGQSLIEDSILAAFWLAMGTTIFALISYITSSISLPMPPPPTP